MTRTYTRSLTRHRTRARKTSLRGHGSFVGGTANQMPPPPGARPSGRGLSFDRWEFNLTAGKEFPRQRAPGLD